VIYFKLLS